MRYCWEDSSLDREGMLFIRQGQQVDISCKTLECIGYLLENRHRVVGYDELIRRIWGHDSIGNNQLCQVILAARRVLGDNGRTQRLIRTAPGLGYRWVGPAIEVDDLTLLSQPPLSTTETVRASAPLATSDPCEVRQAVVTTIPTDPLDTVVESDKALPARALRGKSTRFLIVALLFTAAMILLGIGYATMRPMRGQLPPAAAISPNAKNFSELEGKLAAGKLEDVRESLAVLPPQMANSLDAKLLEIRLDILRGRYDEASTKIDALSLRVRQPKDSIWLARVLTLKSQNDMRLEKSGSETIKSAQQAIDVLQSLGDSVPARELGDALGARGSALSRSGRTDEAMHDMVKARDLYLSIDDQESAALIASNLARILMRTGRLHEALETLVATWITLKANERPIDSIFTLNTISRIQAELLHWDAALTSNNNALRILRTVPNTDRRERVLMVRVFLLTQKGRLNEARAHLEEAKSNEHGTDGVSPPIEAMYHLESGDPDRALQTLRSSKRPIQPDYNFNPMLEDKEGLLLLWIMATQAKAAAGDPVPALPATQYAALATPKTAAGQIARGRWLWARGEQQAAEAQLRLALQEARRMGQTYRMMLASETLIGILLERGDIEAAQVALDDLRAQDPMHVDRDYRISLLDLKIALSHGEPERIRKSYQKSRMLAGERQIPGDIVERYRAAISSVSAKR